MWWLAIIVFAAVAQGEVTEKLQIRSPGSGDVSRIIGGTTTTIDQYPYTVQILNNNNLQCAGSILTNRHVLSAGHCFVDNPPFGDPQRVVDVPIFLHTGGLKSNGLVVSPQQYSVRAGTTYLTSGGTSYPVSTIVVHERYNIPVRDNDIAVLVLTRNVAYSNAVQAAYLPPQGWTLLDNLPVVHVGWGRTIANVASISEVLRHVTVWTINRAVCQARYQVLANQSGYAYPVTENMVCAGLLDIGGADACQGDSGGPMVYGGTVVGITSWGNGCGEPFFPGVSVNVARYTSWVNSTVTRYNSGPPMASISGLLILFSLAISFVINK